MHRVGVWLCSFLLLPIALLDGGTARAVERAFPSTPILDDFDRPDEPSPGGPGWVASVSEQFPGHEGIVVSDNKAASSSLTESASSSWTTEFPQDQEAYFEYGDTPGPNAGMGPAVRLQDPADLESDQYLVFFYQVAFEGRSVVKLWKRSGGTWSQLTDKQISTDLVQGDQIGIRAVGDRIEAFLNGEVVSSYVDPDPILQPGYIQLYVGDDVGHTADNFGGGAVADDLPALLSPVEGSTLPGATLSLGWTPNTVVVSDWWVNIGSTQGDWDIADLDPGDDPWLTVEDLPTDGSPVWVRLWYYSAESWHWQDYSFVAATWECGGGGGPPPPPNCGDPVLPGRGRCGLGFEWVVLAPLWLTLRARRRSARAAA